MSVLWKWFCWVLFFSLSGELARQAYLHGKWSVFIPIALAFAGGVCLSARMLYDFFRKGEDEDDHY